MSLCTFCEVNMKVKVLFASLVLFASAATGHASQVLPESAKQGTVEILAVAEVQRNDGCMRATARTQFPLTPQKCRELTGDRKLQAGDKFFYLFSGGANGWVFSPKSDAYE